MKIITTDIPDLLVFEPRIFGDERGFFLENWHKQRYTDAGIHQAFVQDNISSSQKNVLRGLHFQNPNGQGKLVQVVVGEVFDVAVDIRLGSPTFGQKFEIILSAERKNQVYIPPGFAHGFCVLSDSAIFLYKCTELYHPNSEKTLLWNDPTLGISWPVKDPILSAKDKIGTLLKDFKQSDLPAFVQNKG